MTTEKLISFVAVNQDGTEMAFDSVPEKSQQRVDGKTVGEWISDGNHEILEKGSIEEILGHKLKWNDGHRMCLSIRVPKMNLTTKPRTF